MYYKKNISYFLYLEGGATAHLQKVVLCHALKFFRSPIFLSTTYTIFSKIANFTHHLSQEYDEVGWLLCYKSDIPWFVHLYVR